MKLYLSVLIVVFMELSHLVRIDVPTNGEKQNSKMCVMYVFHII